jgi:hypothetical protein
LEVVWRMCCSFCAWLPRLVLRAAHTLVSTIVLGGWHTPCCGSRTRQCWERVLPLRVWCILRQRPGHD